MTTKRYAAYGSNLHPLRLRKRVPNSQLLGTARIDGWGLRFHKRSLDDSGKGNIVGAPEHIYVAVFELQESEKPKLDKVEGSGYDAIKIDVPNYGMCHTYTASQMHVDDSLIAYSWYKQLVLLGCEYHNLPGRYIETIQSIPERLDPDEERHRENMSIVVGIVNAT